MVIIADYRMDFNRHGEAFYASRENPCCPGCGEKLKYRDQRRRIFRHEGGKVTWISIRRLYCGNCRRLHNELPDCLSPYKHYGAEEIEGAVDEIIHAEDEDCDGAPSEQTITRWKAWILYNLTAIEAYLRSESGIVSEFGKSAKSLFSEIRRQCHSAESHWLGVVNRTVYNAGGALAPLRSVRA